MGFTPPAHQAMVPVKVPNLIKRRTELTKAWENALQAIRNAQEKWGRPTTYVPYKEGDLVWLEGTNLHTTHPTKKLQQKRFGPFKVVQAIGMVSFKLELPPQWKVHPVFHAKLLHPYKETEEHGANFQEPPPDLVDGEPEWEIESILDSRWRKKREQFLIRWKGYSSAHDSWEPQENVHAPQLLEEYKKRTKQGGRENNRKTVTSSTSEHLIRRLSTMDKDIQQRLLTQTKRTPYRNYQGAQAYVDTIGPLEVWEHDPKSWLQDASVAQKGKWYKNRERAMELMDIFFEQKRKEEEGFSPDESAS